MVDVTLLNQTIEERGIKKTWLADKIGCSRPRLYKILEGTDVTLTEVEAISDALGLNVGMRNRIFFAQKVE